jgi:hypothetical protein
METVQNGIVAGYQAITTGQELRIVFGWYRDAELRPVFKQEVDIWNIYCKVI